MSVRLACVLFITGSAIAVVAQTPPARTSMDGVYTEAQAKRAEALYAENCAACHGADLAGDPYAPALAGPLFSAKWRDRPLGDIFDYMRLTMPQTFPNSLSRQQNADLLAFILQRNRLPAGKTELPTQSDALAAIRYASNPQETPAAARGSAAATGPVAPGTPLVADGYYTLEQANRGRALFNTWCTACHVASGAMNMAPTGRGYRLGRLRFTQGIGGSYIQKYPSVYHLFRRVRDSMPSFNADALGQAAKVDIVAYLLQQNGLSAGPAELPLDVAVMKSMKVAGTLNEGGFRRIFNGRDFTGLKFLLGPNCRPAPEGCGRTDPGTTFRVDHGEVVTNGKIQGYMYTEQKYLNFTLRFDFKHVPPADWDPTDNAYFDGNSGYLLFVTEHAVWPKGIEIQGNASNPLHVAPLDTAATFVNEDEALRGANRPAGWWQSVEIVSKDGQVKSYLNGTLVSTVSKHEFKAPGHIAFQSEGAELHWRNIRIKEE